MMKGEREEDWIQSEGEEEYWIQYEDEEEDWIQSEDEDWIQSDRRRKGFP